MRELCPSCYRYERDRDNFEYIYKTSDLIDLPGKSLRQKKNHVNAFRRDYVGYEYVDLGPEHKEECLAVADEWLDEHQTTEDMAAERVGIERVFDNWEALGVKGGAIRIYGKIIAFSIGEYIHPKLAVIHFEKANPNVRGSFQIINQEFVSHAWADTEFINREEDMGIDGLRQAKESYHPDHFAEKYDVYLADGVCEKPLARELGE